jgi:hypothetical protein
MISIGRLRLLTEAVGAADAEPLGRRFAAALQRELRAAGGTRRLQIDELVLDAPGREAAPEHWARQAARAIVQRAKAAPQPQSQLQPSPAGGGASTSLTALQGRESAPAAVKSFSPSPPAGAGQGGSGQALTRTRAMPKAPYGR